MLFRRAGHRPAIQSVAANPAPDRPPQPAAPWLGEFSTVPLIDLQCHSTMPDLIVNEKNVFGVKTDACLQLVYVTISLSRSLKCMMQDQIHLQQDVCFSKPYSSQMTSSWNKASHDANCESSKQGLQYYSPRHLWVYTQISYPTDPSRDPVQMVAGICTQHV